MTGGTPRELLPITEEVLAWVSKQRRMFQAAKLADTVAGRSYEKHLRRIELCALATREAALFFDLYSIGLRTGHLDHIGGDPHGETADPQGQRSEAEGLQGAPEGR